MIYSKRLGSLGNQMHIVAATYATALDNNTEWAVSHKTNEGYRGIIERSSFNDTFFRTIPKLSINTGKRFREESFSYKKIPKEKNLTISGYFQSEKYYGHRRTELLKLFYEYYPEVKEHVQAWFSGLNKDKTISLHIRRTDYVKLAQVHTVQSIDYYHRALEVIAQNLNISLENLLEQYTLLIFSDDLAWCRGHTFFDKPNIRFIENKLGRDLDAVVDLYTMAECAHNVIANSSFSWWGAYLNQNKTKQCIAPKQWFGPRGPKTWDDVYFQGMTIVF